VTASATANARATTRSTLDLPPRRRQIATLSDGASRESPAPRFGRAEDLI
jgi:hypothetical protein